MWHCHTLGKWDLFFFFFIQQRAWLLHLSPCLGLFMGICPPQVCRGHSVLSCCDFQTFLPRTTTFLYPNLTVYKTERCRAELVDPQALSSWPPPMISRQGLSLGPSLDSVKHSWERTVFARTWTWDLLTPCYHVRQTKYGLPSIPDKTATPFT